MLSLTGNSFNFNYPESAMSKKTEAKASLRGSKDEIKKQEVVIRAAHSEYRDVDKIEIIKKEEAVHNMPSHLDDSEIDKLE